MTNTEHLKHALLTLEAGLLPGKSAMAAVVDCLRRRIRVGYPIAVLTDEDRARVTLWSAEQDAAVAQARGSDEWAYGAIGGQLTYRFTPTSIGTMVVVEHALTKATLDLTGDL